MSKTKPKNKLKHRRLNNKEILKVVEKMIDKHYKEKVRKNLIDKTSGEIWV